MNNISAKTALDDCLSELKFIETYIKKHGAIENVSKYLTRYSLIKITGTLEFAYKTIIVEYYETKAPELSLLLESTILNAKSNATYQNIRTMLGKIDNDKRLAYEGNINKLGNSADLISELTALYRTRNELAHGRSITMSFNDIKDKYTKVKVFIEKLDDIFTYIK